MLLTKKQLLRLCWSPPPDPALWCPAFCSHPRLPRAFSTTLTPQNLSLQCWFLFRTVRKAPRNILWMGITIKGSYFLLCQCFLPQIHTTSNMRPFGLGWIMTAASPTGVRSTYGVYWSLSFTSILTSGLNSLATQWSIRRARIYGFFLNIISTQTYWYFSYPRWCLLWPSLSLILFSVYCAIQEGEMRSTSLSKAGTWNFVSVLTYNALYLAVSLFHFIINSSKKV